MGILKKLAFWRKSEDEFSDLSLGPDMGMGKELGIDTSGLDTSGKDLGMPELQAPEAGQPAPAAAKAPPTPEAFQEMKPEPERSPLEMGTAMSPLRTAPTHPAYSPPPESRPSHGKDLEIVSAKLDAIKAYLDTINQRLANLEQIARGEHEKKRWY